MSLSEKICDPSRRDAVVDDCCKLVDDEVQGKKGIGGAVVKTGYMAVKGIKPGFIRSVVNKLLDEWAVQLDPIWAEGETKGNAAGHLKADRSRVAEALLHVTDAKSESAESGVVRSTYKRLRPSAKKHVEEAVPALADLMARHTA